MNHEECSCMGDAEQQNSKAPMTQTILEQNRNEIEATILDSLDQWFATMELGKCLIWLPPTRDEFDRSGSVEWINGNNFADVLGQFGGLADALENTYTGWYDNTYFSGEGRHFQSSLEYLRLEISGLLNTIVDAEDVFDRVDVILEWEESLMNDVVLSPANEKRFGSLKAKFDLGSQRRRRFQLHRQSDDLTDGLNV